MSQDNINSNLPIEYGAGFIQLRPEGYFFVKMKHHECSTVETVKESQRIMTEMLPSGSVYILVDTGIGATSDDDIYDYINKSIFKLRVKAQAIIVHDLATRLMGNIFLRFVKNERHIKIFSKETDAKKWLFERMKNDSSLTKSQNRMVAL